MLKIFGYECRRLLGGKVFLSMAAVTLWTALQTLRGAVIWGIAGTAPFSPWSFGYYLAALLPYLCGAGLLLLAGFYTKPARQTAPLVQAAPLAPWRYALARCGAVALGLGLLCLCVAAMGVVFLRNLFGPVSLSGFGSVAALLLLPLPVLALGLGTVLGRWGAAALYGLAAGLLLLPALPTGSDLTQLRFFQDFPASLGILDPALQLPPQLLWTQGAILLAGLCLLTLGAARRRSQGGAIGYAHHAYK